jgi:hypothetical protein
MAFLADRGPDGRATERSIHGGHRAAAASGTSRQSNRSLVPTGFLRPYCRPPFES